MKSSARITAESATSERGDDRAARLLRGMHRVVSHDLPNQLVALQSLLQLLHADEWDHLGPEGRAHLAQLVGAAERTGAQVRFLKEMARLHRCQPHVEEVALAPLGRELQGELAECAGAPSFAWDWQVTAVRADARQLGLALRELLHVLLEGAPAACRIEGTSRTVGDDVEVIVRIAADGVAPFGRGGRPAEQRPDVVLARERLAAWGARLRLPARAGEPTSFAVLIPR